jgi:alkyl sulfatase BDS1-like metallo-beta-lactamase superfamily hydrolase
MDTLSVSEPEAVVGAVKRLQERVERLQTQHEALAELDVSDPERALQMIENMADQLGELYAEREAQARDASAES